MATNSTQAAAQAAGEAGIMSGDMFLYAAAAGFAALTAYAIHRFVLTGDTYAATPIQERLGRKILGPTEHFGHKLSKRLHYEERPKGYVHRAYRSTTDIDIDPNNELKKSDLEDIEATDGNTSLTEYDSVVYSCSSGGNWAKRQAQKLVYKIGGIGLFRTDEGVNRMATYYDVPVELVEIRNDVIRIKDDADLVQVRDNYYRHNSQQGIEKLRQLTFADMLEDIMQTSANLGEQHHALNIETSREGTLMDKKWQNIMDYNKLKDKKDKEDAMES